MSEPTKTTVAERLADELTPTAPLPVAEVPSYAVAPPERRAEIEKVMAEIDIDDSNSILFFGTSAQGEVTAVADEMLEGVRNKDTGPAGQALNDMLSTLRGFDTTAWTSAGENPSKSPHTGGFHVAFADGSVRFVVSSIDPKQIAAAVTIDGAETVNLD